MKSDENWDWSSFWIETLKQLRDNTTEQEWVMWLSSLTYNSGSENSIKINVPSSFYRDQVSQRYGSVLAETLENICGKRLNIRITSYNVCYTKLLRCDLIRIF